MKRIVLLCACVLSLSTFASQNYKYLQYITQWREVALSHEQMYGVPASITLAQGLLESAAGTSELATEANNHFGIKCTSDWMGDAYRYDDDTKNECFRVYQDAEESFKDHALFLRRTRYARLFEIPVTDYAAWAQGLKECGYATDASYPQKLVRLIEEYRLDTLNQGIPAPEVEPVVAEQAPEVGVVRTVKQEKQLFYSLHGVKRNNGIQYVVAKAGDTYATIAYSLNVKERTLRENNDALGRVLQEGDYVYLGAKRSQAPQSKAYVWVRPGETVWSICQREGITVKSFLKMNGLSSDIQEFSTRQQVALRKEKK